MYPVQNQTLHNYPIPNATTLSTADTLAKNVSVIYCNYMRNPANGQLDVTCGRTLTFSKEAPSVRFEYVKDRLSPKDIQCISHTLPEGKILYQPALASFVNKIIASNPAREILNKVLQDGPLTILSADKRGAPLGGSWEPHARVIRLLESASKDRILGHLLYELCSAEQFDEMTAFYKEIESGMLSKEAYVKRWGELEYLSGKRFLSAVQECIANDAWPKEADLDIPHVLQPDGQWIEWDAFWDLLKNTEHFNQYRKDWENNGILDRYCQKNPRAVDCR